MEYQYRTVNIWRDLQTLITVENMQTYTCVQEWNLLLDADDVIRDMWTLEPACTMRLGGELNTNLPEMGIGR